MNEIPKIRTPIKFDDLGWDVHSFRHNDGKPLYVAEAAAYINAIEAALRELCDTVRGYDPTNLSDDLKRLGLWREPE